MNPPYLRTIRIVLLAAHTAGIAFLFLSGDPSMSPIKVLHWLFTGGVSSGSGRILFVVQTVAPSLGFLAAIAVWSVQGRSLHQQSTGILVTRTAWVIVALQAVCTSSYIVAASIGIMRAASARTLPFTTREWLVTSSIWIVPLAVLIGLCAIFCCTRLIRSVRAPLVMRSIYLAQSIPVGIWYLNFWNNNNRISGPLILTISLFYMIEIAVFVIYGQRHPTDNGAKCLILRYWLPTPDVILACAPPTCHECGYDLRGTIPTGSQICPECGTAIPFVQTSAQSHN